MLIYGNQFKKKTEIFLLIFPGAELGFSGVADFQKFCEILSTIFRSTKLIYRALPNHYKVSISTKFSAPQASKKNRRKKAYLGSF